MIPGNLFWSASGGFDVVNYIDISTVNKLVGSKYILPNYCIILVKKFILQPRFLMTKRQPAK